MALSSLSVVAPDLSGIDLGEMFFGDANGWSIGFLAVRSALMFVFALMMVRITGKRSLGQLSPFDFVIIIALGSAVGDPMLYRDVPFVDAATAVSVVVGLNLVISRATQRYRLFEKFTDSTASVLVRDGDVDEVQLQSENLSQIELGEALRLHGIAHLREVRLAVLEPSGGISVLTVDQPEDADLWRRFFVDEKTNDRWA